ncbi:MAG: hypothetical protein Q8K02_12985 [Flavobacterium sp.]|nr:hypothetical protein [Flavobacterium sp.]
MKIKYGHQLEINEINGEKIDLFLFANNIEDRKLSAFYRIGQNNEILKAFSLYYPNSEINNIDNVSNLIIKSHTQIIDLLESEIVKSDKEVLNLFIDYSCMTKSWYYTMIIFLTNKELIQKEINVYFSYTPSIFSMPLDPKPNTDISPLPGKYIIPNNKPKALIVGLGYEENKAQGIIDQLDPAVTYLFYTYPALDDQFVNAVEYNNNSILEEFKNNTVKYPSNDLLFLENQLSKIYFLLKDKYSVIIAPLGPKPFAFVSMMLSVIFHDIEIWRVGSGEDINPYPRKPFDTDEFIISKVTFELE